MLDNFLQEFVSKDPLRPSLEVAHTIGGFVYASDGHICIKSPVINFKEKHVAPEGVAPVNFDKIRVDAGVNGTGMMVDRLRLDEALKGLPRVDKYEDCPECLGDGEIECLECGQDYECPKCEGKGHHGNLLGQCFHKNSSIRFGDAIFQANLFDLLLRVADTLQTPIKWLDSRNSGVYFFQMGDTEVWIASMMTTEKHHVEFEIGKAIVA